MSAEPQLCHDETVCRNVKSTSKYVEGRDEICLLMVSFRVGRESLASCGLQLKWVIKIKSWERLSKIFSLSALWDISRWITRIRNLSFIFAGVGNDLSLAQSFSFTVIVKSSIYSSAILLIVVRWFRWIKSVNKIKPTLMLKGQQTYMRNPKLNHRR